MLQLEDAYGFVYLTTNLVNGKQYLGKKKFNSDWKDYLGSGVLLSKAIAKYGETNFKKTILHIAYSREELNVLEKEYIEYHNACDSKDYYNIASGGDGGNTLAGKSEKEMRLFKERCSENNKGENNYWHGKGELLKGEKNPFYGRKHSEETKLRLKKINLGKHPSEESRQKMSKSGRGRKHSQESKLKMSKNTKTKIKIICVTTGDVYESACEASRKTGISRSNISACCRNKLKSAGGMVWEYLDKVA